MKNLINGKRNRTIKIALKNDNTVSKNYATMKMSIRLFDNLVI